MKTCVVERDENAYPAFRAVGIVDRFSIDILRVGHALKASESCESDSSVQRYRCHVSAILPTSMSRLSRANLKARDSVFAGGPELYRGDIQVICPPNLEECVRAMEDCCEEVRSA